MVRTELGEIDIICPKCGHSKSKLYLNEMALGQFKSASCIKCNTVTFIDKDNIDKINETGDQLLKKRTPTVTCPFCQSTDCKKISGASKVGKVALFGVFAAGGVSKTWHCNNCGSNFG